MLTCWSPLLHFMWENKLTNLQEAPGPLIAGSDMSQHSLDPSLLSFFPVAFLILHTCLSCQRCWVLTRVR